MNTSIYTKYSQQTPQVPTFICTSRKEIKTFTMLTLNNTVSKSCIVLLKVIKGTEALNYKQKVCCKLKKEFVYVDSVM